MATTKKRPVKAKAAEEAVEETVVNEEPVVQKPAVKKRVFDLHEYVQVKNGFHGKLVYKSRATGERFVWEQFGDELDMELKELRDAKVSRKGLFVNNYFVIEDKEVLEYLGLSKYYNNAIPIDCFDDIFDLPPEELEEKLKALPEGQKSSVAYRARVLYKYKAIDSLKTIEVLEKVLNIQLTVKD